MSSDMNKVQSNISNMEKQLALLETRKSKLEEEYEELNRRVDRVREDIPIPPSPCQQYAKPGMIAREDDICANPITDWEDCQCKFIKKLKTVDLRRQSEVKKRKVQVEQKLKQIRKIHNDIYQVRSKLNLVTEAYKEMEVDLLGQESVQELKLQELDQQSHALLNNSYNLELSNYDDREMNHAEQEFLEQAGELNSSVKEAVANNALNQLDALTAQSDKIRGTQLGKDFQNDMASTSVDTDGLNKALDDISLDLDDFEPLQELSTRAIANSKIDSLLAIAQVRAGQHKKLFDELSMLRGVNEDYDRILQEYELDILRGFFTTGILNAVDGGTDLILNSLGYLIPQIKKISEFKGNFKAVHKSIIKYKKDGNKYDFLISSLNNISKIEKLELTKYLTDISKTMQSNPSEIQVLYDWAKYSASYLNVEDVKLGFQLMEDWNQIFKGIHEMGSYELLNTKMSMQIAEQKAKNNFRIAEIKRELNKLK